MRQVPVQLLDLWGLEFLREPQVRVAPVARIDEQPPRADQEPLEAAVFVAGLV